MKKTFIFVIILLFDLVTIHAQGIGTWKNYMAYSEITDIQKAGNTLYILASNSLYSYNTQDQSIWTYNKAKNLNDCVIQAIGWSQTAQKLIIIYETGNIDLMDKNDNISNISEYETKTMTEDKTIYGLDVIDQYAYMSTGFGIVKINLSEEEITNTYNLGFRVDYCYIEGNRIFAASSTQGIYSASLDDNLLDSSVWSYYSAYTPKDKTIDPDLLAIAETLSPGGPNKNWFYYLSFTNDRLYSAGGMFLTGTGSAGHIGTIQILDGNDWSLCENDLSSIIGANYLDINCVAADPKDPDHLFAGGKAGMFEFRNCKLVKYFNATNSPIQRAIDNGVELSDNYTLVHSIMFGQDNNLWLLNSQAKSNSIIEYNLSSGEFTLHDKSELINSGCSLAAMIGLMTDSRGLIWFVNNHYYLPSFYCYQPSTDALNSYIPNINQDGTSLGIQDGIKCIKEDLDGNIWVGTDIGPLLLYASDITSSSPTYNQVKVPRNDGTNYADYLLVGIDILSMAIDAGNRKWFGTNGNGVYLISEDNMTQLQHFTSEETPLLSNIVSSIDIDDKTGEVFFGTDNGLCSYMSDATQTSEKMTKDNVYAYPNPVKPDYTGLITITGLTLDADVKIVTSNGYLVAQGRSQGGTFTWDGLDTKGKKVASGVYMVETATSEGKKGTVCKIAIVR